MKKILLTGANGFMGKMIRECAKSFDEIEIVAGVDIYGESNGLTIYKTIENVTFPVDVIIDFSHPSLLEDVLTYAEKYKVPAVIATTGLSTEQQQKIKNLSKTIPMFLSANMSLGINLICELLKKAAPVLKNSFDIEIIEKHHNRKIDAPSGTALLLADSLNEEEEYSYNYDRHSTRQPRNKKEIGIASIRGGTIIGEHDVIFAGDDEVITFSHSAQSRKVFANGALRAAEFLSTKKEGLFSMKNLIEEAL